MTELKYNDADAEELNELTKDVKKRQKALKNVQFLHTQWHTMTAKEKHEAAALAERLGLTRELPPLD